MADPLSIDIRHAVLIKNAELFVITERDGSVPRGPPGFGLFYRDCCYLSGYEFSLNGTHPLLLMSAWDEGFAADIELANTNLRSSNGKPIPTHTLGVTRKHLIIGDECAFVDTITFRNFSLEEVELPFALEFAAGFESIFVLRGAPPGKRGSMHVPEWKDHHIRFSYLGADDILRRRGILSATNRGATDEREDDREFRHHPCAAGEQGSGCLFSCRGDS
ncbi:MAG: glycogen debranching N-terminal domain-containing protein [Methylocella sp.]